jgi:hypothetical protein
MLDDFSLIVGPSRDARLHVEGCSAHGLYTWILTLRGDTAARRSLAIDAEQNSYDGRFFFIGLLPRCLKPVAYLPDPPSQLSIIDKQEPPKSQRNIDEQHTRESEWHPGNLPPRR